MTQQLTTIAALPQAGGCQSALPAERQQETPWVYDAHWDVYRRYGQIRAMMLDGSWRVMSRAEFEVWGYGC